MPLSVTGPLLEEHAQIRELMGALDHSLTHFNLPAIRKVVIDLFEIVEPHSLKEETGLFLVGMKRLQAGNAKIPDLIVEHHGATKKLHDLVRILYFPRLTAVEDHLRIMGSALIEELDHHLNEEEQVVFPAFERLLEDELKQIILDRYRKIGSHDDLDRTPLLSLPPLDPQRPLPLPTAPPPTTSTNTPRISA